MLKSVNQWCFPDDTPYKESVALAAKCGYEAFEPAVGESGELTPDTSPAKIDELRKLIEDSGLKISSLASGFGWTYPCTSSDKAIRQKGVDLLRSQIAIAQRMGAPVILAVPGMSGTGWWSYQGNERYDEAYDNALESFSQLKADAEAAKVIIGIENVWNKFLISPLEMRDFIDKLNSPYIGSYFDVGNLANFGVAEHWIAILGKRIARVHVKDYRNEAGGFAGFVDLLAGDVNWPAVVEALKAIGYDGPLTAEIGGYKTFTTHNIASISGALDAILGRKCCCCG